MKPESEAKPAADEAPTADEAAADEASPADEEAPPAEETASVPLKKLLQFRDKRDTWAIALGALAAFAQGCAMPAFTVILGDATDSSNVSTTGNDESLVSQMREPLINMCYLILFVFVTASTHATLFEWSSQRQGGRIRRAYLGAALARDQTWFDLHDAAALPTRMAVESGKVVDAIGPKLGLVVVPFGQFIGGMVVGLWRGWQLSLVIICFFPLMGLSAYWLSKAAKLEASQSWYARAGAVAEEVLFSMRTVAAFGAEKRETKRYGATLQGAAAGGTRAGVYAALGFAWLFATFGLSYAVAFWFSGQFLFRQGDASVFDGGGDVINVFFAAIMGVAAVNDAAMPLNTVAAGLSAGAALFAVVDATSTIEGDGAEAPREAAPSGDIRFDDVSFSYPSRPEVPVLAGMSCTIARGQRVAFVGESGSGKSTTIQLLLRFYDPARGAVSVGGVDLRTVPVASWRRRVGYVGQEPVLFATSVLENIRLANPRATVDECRAAARSAEALAFLDALPDGFDTEVGQGGGALSGGQKQRVAIARALVGRPAVLLLDEATSALDNASEKLVQATLDDLAGRGDLTTVSVSHRLSTVKNCDVIFVLADGAVAERGTHDALVAAGGLYHKLTKAQEAVHEPAPLTGARLAAIDESAPGLARPSLGVRASTVSSAGRSSDLDYSFTAAAATLRRAAPGVSVTASLYDDVSGRHSYDASGRRSSDGSGRHARLAKVATDLNELARGSIKSRGSSEPVIAEAVAVEPVPEEPLPEAPVRRIFDQFASSRVKLLFIPALIACIFDGLAMPAQGYVLADAIQDFYLPYKCPPRCAADPPAANATFAELDCWEARECRKFRPKNTNSPLKYRANRNAMAFLVISLVQFVAVFSKMSLYRHIQEQMTATMREQYLGALVRQEIGFFDDPAHSSGTLTTTLAKQTQLVAGITGLGLGSAVSTFFALFFGVFLAFRACWRLALAMLCAIPVIMVAMGFVFKLIMGAGGSEDAAFAGAGAVASEAVLNVKTVRAAGATKEVIGRFEHLTADVVVEKTSVAWRNGVAYGVGMVLVFALYLITFGFGPVCVDRGWCSPTQMWKAMFCLLFGAFGAGSGAVFAQDATKAKQASHDVFRVLDRASAVDATRPSGVAAADSFDLTFNNVSFSYPTRENAMVLRDLSLKVPAGSTTALVGPSGSGKSTIVQLLLRFYDAGAGEVLIGQVELTSIDVKWYRSIVGLVGQEPVLFDASLAENVRYGAPDAPQDALDRVAVLAKLDFLLDGRLKWGDGLGPRGGRLSGGQKQRVAIARALVRDPKILLLDEATSALDSESEAIVAKALESARVGRTTVVIAHRLSTIEDSDQIVVMVDGSVAEAGTHESLLKKKGVYHTLQTKAHQ